MFRSTLLSGNTGRLTHLRLISGICTLELFHSAPSPASFITYACQILVNLGLNNMYISKNRRLRDWNKLPSSGCTKAYISINKSKARRNHVL